eukprot:UN28443
MINCEDFFCEKHSKDVTVLTTKETGISYPILKADTDDRPAVVYFALGSKVDDPKVLPECPEDDPCPALALARCYFPGCINDNSIVHSFIDGGRDWTQISMQLSQQIAYGQQPYIAYSVSSNSFKGLKYVSCLNRDCLWRKRDTLDDTPRSYKISYDSDYTLIIIIMLVVTHFSIFVIYCAWT